ncbi:MAG: YdbL family protein [Proteobacteria bacterium]|nr:YdbL family protein [Pseudomonadota bacterium]
MSSPNRSSNRFLSLSLLAAILSVLLALAEPSSVALAQTQPRLLDAPRVAGQVGERYDGYAVARGAVAADIAALIERVNAERRAVYAQRAASDKAPIEAVGKIYAQQIMQSAPAGTWFLSETGQWSRR